MQRQTNNQILVPTDFSEVANNALNHAVTVAKAFKNSITLLSIVEENFLSGLFSGNQGELVKEAIENRLEKLATEIRNTYNVEIHTRIESGRVYKVISDIANAENFDSIIMGSHGASGFEQVIGSNASRTIQYAKVPVVVVKNQPIREGYKKIIMPIDLSIESRQKVEWGVHVGKMFDSEVHIVYTGSSDEFTSNRIRATIKHVEHDLTAANVRFVTSEIEDKMLENFATEVLSYAENVKADLVLVMTHTEKGLTERVIGTLTQQLVNRSENIPVMCIYPTETGFTYDY
ncbi:MAG: universal stress protein [Bacteroidia bacterium]|nr:universal stress protein [Bacteroidia bacterium]